MSMTTALAGVMVLLFTVVPSAKLPTTAHANLTITAQNGSLPNSSEVDTESLAVTFWSYLALRTSYG